MPDHRITCVISSLGCGGAERVMVRLTRWLAAFGYRVTVLTLDSHIPDHFAVFAPVNRQTLPENALTSCRWFDWSCQRRRNAALREAILRENPQVVISFIDTVNVAVLMALSGSGIPVIAAEHTDPRYHAIGWRWSLLRRLWYPRAYRVIMLTGPTLDWARSRWPRWRAGVIPNPVEPLPVALAKAPRPDYFATRTIVALGRLGREKGFDLLIEAFATLAGQYADWNLVIFGEGGERAVLEALIGRLNLADRVYLPGTIKQPETLLPHADLFVLSSRFEGFPMALTEAMQCGVPVIGFNTPSGGPATIIRDGIDGLLVPHGNVGALREAMARLMGDEAERWRLGERARDVGERFAPERIVDLWRQVIEQAVGAAA